MTDANPDNVIVVPEDVNADELLAHLTGGPLPQGATLVPFDVWTAQGRVEDCDCKMLQCVCATARIHDKACFFRKAFTCAIGIPCDDHNDDVCPDCYPCTCPPTVVGGATPSETTGP